MRAIAAAICFAVCISSAASQTEEQDFATQAIAAMVAGVRLGPEFLPNPTAVRAAVTASKLDIDARATKERAVRYGEALERRQVQMGKEPFCTLMWTGWGAGGQIIPDVLIRR